MESNITNDGGTRTGAGSRFWKNEWHLNFPKTGKGKFVYQHHWSGLVEDEISEPEAKLLNTNKSVHGDLRFEGPNGLWGISLFLGTTTENRFSFGDAFTNADSTTKLQVAFKTLHDNEWLEKAWTTKQTKDGTRFFSIDEGTYSIGVWKQNLFEVFLHGKYLNGRYLIQGVPFGVKKRTFLISRPRNQTPLAVQRTEEDVRVEQLEKGSDWLVWCRPEENPVKISLKREGSMEKAFTENERGFNEAETLVIVNEHGRFSKGDANYYEYYGRDERSCQNCVFFRAGGVDEDGTCRVVKGPIGNEATSSFFIPLNLPGQLPVLENELSRVVPAMVANKVLFAKAGDESDPFGFVLAPILVPEVTDLQGDIVSVEEIEKAAHGYMEDSQQGGFMHTEELGQDDAVLVESYLVRADSEIAGVVVSKGTWIGGWRVYNKSLRKLIREGKITGVSIGGASLGEIEEDD